MSRAQLIKGENPFFFFGTLSLWRKANAANFPQFYLWCLSKAQVLWRVGVHDSCGNDCITCSDCSTSEVQNFLLLFLCRLIAGVQKRRHNLSSPVRHTVQPWSAFNGGVKPVALASKTSFQLEDTMGICRILSCWGISSLQRWAPEVRDHATSGAIICWKSSSWHPYMPIFALEPTRGPQTCAMIPSLFTFTIQTMMIPWCTANAHCIKDLWFVSLRRQGSVILSSPILHRSP